MTTDKRKLVGVALLATAALGMAGFSITKSSRPEPLPEIAAGPNARTQDDPEVFPGGVQALPHNPNQEK